MHVGDAWWCLTWFILCTSRSPSAGLGCLLLLCVILRLRRGESGGVASSLASFILGWPIAFEVSCLLRFLVLVVAHSAGVVIHGAVLVLARSIIVG